MILRAGLIPIVVVAASIGAAQTQHPDARSPRPNAPDPHDILRKFRIAAFAGTTQDSIQAAATDSSGNIYVAGTTYSAQFPVKDAEQGAFGDATILQTTDLGMNWTRVEAPPGGALSLVVDPVTPQVMFASAPKSIFKSANSGQPWQLAYSIAAGSNSPAGGAPLAIDPGNHLHIAAVVGGTLIRSLDGGTTWTMGGNGCCGQLLADPTGSGTLLIVSLGSSFISRDWGLTFQTFGYGPNLTAAAFDPSHPGWIYADFGVGVGGTLYLTTDYGATFTQKASPPAPFSGISYLAVDPDQPTTLVAETSNNDLYKNTDGASSWTLQTSTSEYNFNPGTFLLVPDRCSASGGLFGIGYTAFATPRVAFSPDFGITWQTPELTGVSSVVAGGNCTYYVTRALSSDAFVSKISPDGKILWTTYLGGSDQDAAIALALDSQANVYVTGNTSSPDFPITVPHIGPQGENSVFLTKFSTDGAVIYSATFGGEATNTAVALAVDASQNAYVAGSTGSLKFPVTPGTIVTSLNPQSYTGFLAKLSSSATLIYATYLGVSYTTPSAMLVDANEDVILAGSGPVPGLPPPPNPNGPSPVFVAKLNDAASQLLASGYLPRAALSVTGLAVDSQNNLLAFGQSEMGSLQATAGAYSSPQPASCNQSPLLPEQGDAYVIKLSAANWATVYTTILRATCGINTGAITLDATGDPILAMAASSGLRLHNPILAGPACGTSSSAIAKLSADGTMLQFSTYLDNCGVPAIALAPDASLYAGVSPPLAGSATEVLRLPIANSSAVSLDGVSNAFSGDASAVVFGGLYSIAISGFEPASANLGLNPTQNLPTELSGVQVLFDGAPAPILATGPGQIIIAAPTFLATIAGPENSARNTIYASLQVVYNGVASNLAWVPVSSVLPGLLTVDFPNMPPAAAFPDAKALNTDSTENSADDPAAAGSTITLFATGLGQATPWTASGSVAHSSAVSPVTPIYSSWETPSFGIGQSPPTLAVSSSPGFVSAVFQIQVPIPADIQGLNGTDAGNGVSRVSVGLLLQVIPDPNSEPVSNIVGVYVK